MVIRVLVVCPSDHMADRKAASPESTVPPTAGLEKEQNPNFKVWFPLNDDHFYTVIKLKTLQSNQCKQLTTCPSASINKSATCRVDLAKLYRFLRGFGQASQVFLP